MSKSEKKRPEWFNDRHKGHGESSFTSNVMDGVSSPMAFRSAKKSRRRKLSVEDYVDGILAHDRTIMARAITLVESNAAAHQETAQAVLQGILPHAGKSVRVGITGVPGVGKSTFIETLGMELCQREKKVAVLAVDPSSTLTGGSVLGDKTRMEELSRQPDAFIRPSPSSGTLGGVARKSRETILICEAGGYEVILVETVGVGQSEVTVRSMVDFFLLLMLAQQGDELQGIKKGVIEMADAILVNKADGDNVTRARQKKAEVQGYLQFLQSPTPGWTPRALTCSAQTGAGVPELWETIGDFSTAMRESGFFEERRKSQAIQWAHSMIEELLKNRFYRDPAIRKQLPATERQITEGKLTPTAAVEALFELFDKQ